MRHLRRVHRSIVVVVAGAALLLLSAAPAGAHAELEETSPSNGAALDAPPRTIRLRFSEPVAVPVGGIRIYDDEGRRLDRADPHHSGGRGDTVELDSPDLDDGAYVVTWRVVSADSHPVHGAFTFRVGDAATGKDSQAVATRLLNADGGDTTVGAVYALDRMLVFSSLLVLVGAAAFVLALWPAGLDRRRVRRLIAGAWLAAVLSTAAGIALQGPYGSGFGLADAADPDLLSGVLDTRFGRVSLVRLGLLAVAGVLLWAVTRRRNRPASGVALAAHAAIGIALLATPGLAGHAATGTWVAAALPADTLHLAAVAVWLGGLTILTVDLLPRGVPDELGVIVPGFSRVAFGAVVTILATGTFQSIRQLGSVDALTGTTYGRLLLAKVALFTGMVALAALSRSWVRRRYAAPALASTGPGAAAATDVGRFRRSVGAEVAVAIAVLAVTALLVNAVPGRTALAIPYSTELQASENLLIDVTIDPAKAGPLDLHVYTLTPAGLPAEVEEVTARLDLPDRDIGPLPAPLQRAGPNHFVAYGFDVPISGNWQLAITARTSDIHQETSTTEVHIR